MLNKRVESSLVLHTECLLKNKNIEKTIFSIINLKGGISLIVLIIIIIIIIILTGTVILSFTDNNSVDKANEAIFKDKLSKYQEIITITLLNKKKDSILDNKKYIDDYSSWKPGENIEGTIKEIIPEISDKDANKFEIVDGKLVSNGNVLDKEKEWLEDLSIQSKLGIDITVSPNGSELKKTVNIDVTATSKFGNEIVKIKYLWDTDSNKKLVSDKAWDSAIEYNGTITKTDLGVTNEYLHIFAYYGDEAKTTYVSNIFNNSDLVPPADATYTLSPNDWAKDGITVTLDYPEDAIVKQYKILPSDVWVDYTSPFKVTENTSILVRSEDISGNENTAVTIVIDKIDKTLPNVATISSSNITSTGFRLNVEGEDLDSGIAKYEIYVDSTLVSTKVTDELSTYVDITGKTTNTNYTCFVKVYDAVGNVKQSNNITVTPSYTAIGDLQEGAKLRYNGRDYRLLYDGENGDPFTGKVEIISSSNIGSATLTSENGYANAINILNGVANAVKGKKAISARSVGSNPASPSAYGSISTGMIICYGGRGVYHEFYSYIVQSHFTIDLNKMISLGINSIGQSYFLAARSLYDASFSQFCIKVVNEYGGSYGNAICAVHSDNRHTDNSPPNHGVRAVLAFKPSQSIRLISGSNNVYEIY